MMPHLFSDFKPSSASDWKNQIIKDLKGEAYESLVWHNENGFDIEPFYTQENLKHSYEPAFTHSNWEICVNAKYKDEKHLNAHVLQSLDGGASAIAVNCHNLDLDKALQDVELEFIQSTFYVCDEKNAIALKNYFLENEYEPNDIKASLFIEKFHSQNDFETWKKIAPHFSSFHNIKTVAVNVLPYHNLNCYAYYEVAIIFSALVEYLEFFAQEKKFPEQDFVIKTGVSSDYFLQIAKLRAIRRIWNVLKKEYNIANNLYIIAETSLTNKTVSDNYNNLLRSTVEAMAAVAGGCNELIVTEFDALFPVNTKLSERMAINQQLILKDESYLDKFADVSCGSYYIETLTDNIVEKALETFKGFEKKGGYFVCEEKNIFKKEIAEQAQQRAEALNSQKQIFIGVNKFKNEKEKISLSDTDIERLKKMHINNPVLNFELEKGNIKQNIS